MNNSMSRVDLMRMNKNLIDRYNPEQEEIKDKLWEYFKYKSYTYAQFSRILGITQQSLLNIFRGGRMTHKIAMRLKLWLEVHQ